MPEVTVKGSRASGGCGSPPVQPEEWLLGACTHPGRGVIWLSTSQRGQMLNKLWLSMIRALRRPKEF